jgi:hypothetical protein
MRLPLSAGEEISFSPPFVCSYLKMLKCLWISRKS